jgi:hypothetical protein
MEAMILTRPGLILEVAITCSNTRMRSIITTDSLPKMELKTDKSSSKKRTLAKVNHLKLRGTKIGHRASM